MQVSIDWINQYLDKPLGLGEISSALTASGLEIESASVPPELDSKIVVAEVLEVKDHPSADRLKLAHVKGRSKAWVVCGAPNAVVGILTAWAQPGSRLPDGREIKQASIRGVESAGMLCSAQELGWGEDHEGIVELGQRETPGAPVKAPVSGIINLASPANRFDLLSVVGLAREVAAQTDSELNLPKSERITASEGKLVGQLPGPELVARYSLVKMKLPSRLPGSPDWLRQFLLSAGMRPINLVVDVTNFVMLEWGQPLHAFNAAALKLPLSVRQAGKAEKITTLDGQQRLLDSQDLVIADKGGPVALAGVMGGKDSQFNPGDTDLVLEAAAFSGVSVRKTAQRHTLRSEASARFERGLPVQLAEHALARAVNLLIDLADARLVEADDRLQVWPWVQHVGARVSRLGELTGLELTHHHLVDRLTALGFDAERFDVADEAKKHLGKPYKLGASFRQDGVEAFDCSYLTDYIYSLIGKSIGHTAHQQYKQGRAVGASELQPGDLLFRGGVWEKLDAAEREGVAHDAIYIGDGAMVEARDYTRVKGKWEKIPEGKRNVARVEASQILEDPDFLGARRYVEDLDDYVAVTVPWWRPDVTREEDVAEEVVKLIGYDCIPTRLPFWQPVDIPSPDDHWPFIWDIKEQMRASGWFEVITYSFLSAKALELVDHSPPKHLELKNPLSSEQAYLRSDLLPSLVEAAANNDRVLESFGLFEISRVFRPGKQLDEAHSLGLLVKSSPSESYIAVKSSLDRLARKFGWETQLRAKPGIGLHPQKAAVVEVQGKTIGRIGELHPRIAHELKINATLSYLEIDLAKIKALRKPEPYQPISRFPASERDVALVIKEDIWWQDVEAAVQESQLAKISFLSDWRGEGVKPGYKSLAIRLTIGSLEKTLTEPEVQDVVNQVSRLLAKKFKAEIR